MSLAVLFGSQYAATPFTTVYTAAAATIIDKCTATNVSVTDVTVTICLVPSGDSANTGNAVVVVSVPAGQAYLCGEVVGHILALGDVISLKADTAGAIVVRGSGRTA